jgi:putative flippase GtrA
LTRQLVRFLLVGASNTAITLAVYALLVRGGTPAVVASVAGSGAGAVNGFVLNGRWTFRSDRRGAGAAARYALVLALGLGINASGVALAVDVARLSKMAGEVAALPPMTATTFLLSRAWVFGAGGGRRGRRAVVARLR